MKKMAKLSLLAPLAAGSLFLGGCVGPGFVSVGYDAGYPAYYGGGPYDEDFYYEGATPYSVEYGPLFYRGGSYYYRHGHNYATYNRPTARYEVWSQRHPHGYRHVRRRGREERRDARY
jgi:hypothetical protein